MKHTADLLTFTGTPKPTSSSSKFTRSAPTSSTLPSPFGIGSNNLGLDCGQISNGQSIGSKYD
jgi:hypothetical protein